LNKSYFRVSALLAYLDVQIVIQLEHYVTFRVFMYCHVVEERN